MKRKSKLFAVVSSFSSTMNMPSTIRQMRHPKQSAIEPEITAMVSLVNTNHANYRMQKKVYTLLIYKTNEIDHPSLGSLIWISIGKKIVNTLEIITIKKKFPSIF